MSNLYVLVTTIDDVMPHSNADALDLALVGGWQCVIRKGQYSPGDKVVYFPPDTILTKEMSDKLNVTKYLSNGRIKCAKLRGEPSFGLLITPEPWMNIGDNVADFYGATKWEPPKRISNGSALAEHVLFPKYCDIENMRHFPKAFDDGEEVIVTEKIHGANCRVGVVDGEFMAGSRRVTRKNDDNCLYWKPFEKVSDMLKALSEKHKQVIVYGEIFGQGIQSMTYGASLSFRAFDLFVDGNYIDFDKFALLCNEYNVETVPVLYRGEYSLSKIKQLSIGKSVVGGDHIREGVVVKPVCERNSPKIGRLILKYVSDDYLLGKHSDATEE